MKVTIIFKGVGLNYQKDGVWKIIFPIDECHLLTLNYQKNNGESISVGSLARAGSHINISAVNSSTMVSAAANIQDFIDLTASYSHDEGVEFRNDWRNHGVEMTIGSGFLSVDEFSPKPFVMSERASIITKEPSIIGATLRAEIVLDDEGRVDVEVDGTPIQSFNYETDTTYTLIFDNDCPEENKLNPKLLNPAMTSPGKNDFYMYYLLVKDIEDEKRVFALTALPKGADASKFKVGVDINTLIKGTSTDPFPCYKVIASKINSTFP